ncbi:uncharacterized protein [Physcomitrium patens]|uniref:PHD-type domain-containing protein n=1 Tax=Physcomitrium patens TaxID=3218 RepID=A0A7I4EMF8_PHYPA|nr:uncharacterized protein LOC112286827 isoform X2 [Physcomitrium patens]|eukprot:XP_024384908.1 uncharacterized protein LOC112286827 isoform X2 [Physcomitrella patens]
MMNPKAPLKAGPSLGSTQNQSTSESSRLVKLPAEVANGRSRQSRAVTFSDFSSETEYTSSSSGEAASHENGNGNEYKSNGTAHRRDRLPQAPHEGLPHSTGLHEIKSENVVYSPPDGGVQNGQTSAPPSSSTQRVVVNSTVTKERKETDSNGREILVVDLSDSEDDIRTPLKELRPLCKKCQALKNKQHIMKVTKVTEKEDLDTSKVTLVVDLTETSPPVKDSHIGVGEGKESERRKVPFDVLNSASSKANGEEVVAKAECSRGRIETVIEFPPKYRPPAESIPEVLRVSTTEVEEHALSTAEDSEDEASTLSADYRKAHSEGNHVEKISPDWSPGILCDLCERGPSLSLGAWYSWCCGNPSLGCPCTSEGRQRKVTILACKSGKSTDRPWSGKVHKLCGLWSAEVYEDDKHPWRINNLWDAMRRSRKFKCSDPDCGLFGATLRCRVGSCKKNYHYPCADKLSVYGKLRMWEGLVKPVACLDHRHFNDVVDTKPQKESKKRKRRKKGPSPALVTGSNSKLGERTSGGADDVIDIESSEGEYYPHGATGQDQILQRNTSNGSESGVARTKRVHTPDSQPKPLFSMPPYLGKNLLRPDFSGGVEPIPVPCTNDVDSDPPPYLKEYITKSRYQGIPLGSNECSHPLLLRQAKACEGCVVHDPDDPSAPMSIHIPFERREDDFREDWLKERMYGRLPYDKYRRLVVGTDYNELVECNERCGCGEHCINKEMQKGLSTPIELYKTVNKGWAVRTLVAIPRGRFVIEYVGEMLTQDQAQRYGSYYDALKRSFPWCRSMGSV